jgi:hypothetical protein
MSLLSKEHYELMLQFEKQFTGRFDKEEKSLWAKGNVYQDSMVNQMFVVFRAGYALGKAVHQ